MRKCVSSIIRLHAKASGVWSAYCTGVRMNNLLPMVFTLSSSFARFAIKMHHVVEGEGSECRDGTSCSMLQVRLHPLFHSFGRSSTFFCFSRNWTRHADNKFNSFGYLNPMMCTMCFQLAKGFKKTEQIRQTVCASEWTRMLAQKERQSRR